MHGYQLERTARPNRETETTMHEPRERTARPRQRSSATALSATGAKGWAILTERSEFHCAPRSERLRPPQLTVLSTTLLVTNLLLLSRRRAPRRASAPPACTSQHLPRSTILHELHLSIMSYLPWLKWRGGCGWVAKLSRSCCWNTGLHSCSSLIACYKGGLNRVQFCDVGFQIALFRLHLLQLCTAGPSSFCDPPASMPPPLAPRYASDASAPAGPPSPRLGANAALPLTALELPLEVPRAPWPLHRDEGRVVALARDGEGVGDARPG